MTINVAALLVLLACAAVVGWAAVGTNTDRPTESEESDQ